jgi:imidazolonepropionase-like amidohydrolase
MIYIIGIIPTYWLSFRTIEPGKEANMIVLAANPINDISNTKKIDGKFVDREKILLNR